MPPPQERKALTYKDVGVDYDKMDPLKRMAQLKARETAHNLLAAGYREVEASRGETAYIWEEQHKFGVQVLECLGTKIRVAEEMRKIIGKTYLDQIAQDDVAMIVNDIAAVGARPLALNAYFAAGSADWFADQDGMRDLTDGFRDACNKAGVAWGGGESPTLKGIIGETTADIAGSCVGEIKPKKLLTLGEKIKVGDRIVIVESSGIHANGLSLARGVADLLPDGYATRLPDGTMYGEALLKPTHIYSKLDQDLTKSGIDTHYRVHISGHGWAKLMRAERDDLSYEIDVLPDVPPEFSLIQEISKNTDEQTYKTLNMGGGFAFYVPARQADKVVEIAQSRHGLKAINAGEIREGPRQVIIQPKNIVYRQDALGVR